jgi:hypothetical protein
VISHGKPLFDFLPRKKFCLLRSSGALRSNPISSHLKIPTWSPTNKMSRRNTPGTVPFALDISTEAKSRFMALHEAFGFKSKTATFEAVVFAMSLKDKIDPQILQRIDAKLDRVLETLEETL